MRMYITAANDMRFMTSSLPASTRFSTDSSKLCNFYQFKFTTIDLKMSALKDHLSKLFKSDYAANMVSWGGQPWSPAPNVRIEEVWEVEKIWLIDEPPLFEFELDQGPDSLQSVESSDSKSSPTVKKDIRHYLRNIWKTIGPVEKKLTRSRSI